MDASRLSDTITPSRPPCARCKRRPRASRSSSYCRPCNRELNRLSRERVPQVRALLEAKRRPCVDCGIELPPEVMECDHVRGTKSFALTQGTVRRRTLDAVLAEIAKCDVRCPNCHRMRHYREWNEA